MMMMMMIKQFVLLYHRLTIKVDLHFLKNKKI